MRIKKLVSIVAILLILSSCSSYVEIVQPVSETDFPIGVVRQSDGVQLTIGMPRYEVENILGQPFEEMGVEELSRRLGWVNEEILNVIEESIAMNLFTYQGVSGFISVFYDINNFSTSISISSNEWIIAGEISVGDSIQNILNNYNFLGLSRIENDKSIVFYNPHNAASRLLFNYDENGKVTLIMLGFMDTDISQ